MTVFILLLMIQSGVSTFIYHNIEENPLNRVLDNNRQETIHVDATLHQIHQKLSITDSIVNAIESSIASFDDPIVIGDFYEIYSSDKISYKIQVKGITISGLSSTVINDVSIRILPTRVVFDLTVPQLVLNVDSCVIVIVVHGIRIDVNISGQILVTNSRLRGTIGIRLLPPGVSSVNANLQIGTIKSSMVGRVADVDIEHLLTSTLEHYLPLILTNLSGQINAVLSNYILEVIQSQI